MAIKFLVQHRNWFNIFYNPTTNYSNAPYSALATSVFF
jgi:hypothetical protein